MKKTIITIIMLLCLCGCANKDQPLPEKDPAPTVQQTIQTEEKGTGSTPEKQEEGSSLPATSTTDSKKEQPVKTGENKKPETGNNISSVKTDTKSDTEPVAVSAPAPTLNPSASTASVSNTKPATTPKQPPAPTSTPNATPKPASTPASTPKPTPAPAPTPEAQVDISYWVSYAKSYAGSLGLNLDSSAVDCWDTPITASIKSTCLERDISSRLNRYVASSDITDVWIWSESIGNGSYNIYIGYA